MRTLLVLSLLLALRPTASLGQIQFRDDASALGIDFVWNETWAFGDLGSGVALEDFDGDGDLDIFIGTKTGQPLRVYRNDGGSFTDISDQLGIAIDYDIKQVLFADLDNSGHRDLVLSLWVANGPIFTAGRLMILRNEAGAGFTDVSTSPVDSLMYWYPTGIAAGDIDRDGDLDLYVSVWKAGTPGDDSRNRLLRNDGDFVFNDVAGHYGVDDNKKSYQSVLTDLNGDGWLDIVVAEDKFGGMTYYESDGLGGFVDRTVASGLDGYIGPPGTNDPGLYIDGMGIAVGDHDNDGDLDLYVTNVFEGNVLYENRGDGTFVNVAIPTGTVNYRVGWGCGFLDLDQDGWLDLYVVDFGMNVGTDTAKLDRVYRNNGPGGDGMITYTDVGPAAGIVFPDDGFGMAAGDLDLDGRIDVVVSNGDAPVRVYRNLTPQIGRWLYLSLQGTTSNRDGIGARVEVSAGGRTWMREQRAGTSYLSFDSHDLEFGLGQVTAVDEIRVWWPSGHVDVWQDQPVNTRLRLVEGGDVTVSNLELPVVRGGFDGREFLLHWETSAPGIWRSFEIERRRASRSEVLALVASEPNRTSYIWTDVGALPGDEYRLFALRAGERHFAASLVADIDVALARVQVAAAVPNPFNPHTTLRFTAPYDVQVRLRIVDAQGRSVRSFEAPEAVGWREIDWNGTDDNGRPVASGSYRFVVEAGGELDSTPLTLVR